METIPRKIFSIWLGDEMPAMIRKCIDSQKIEGYEHHLINLDNYPRSQYADDCVKAKNWVKASDYIRAQYIFENGGIYLDSDMEILPGKNFDDMLAHDLFVGCETNTFLANSIIGAKKGNKILEQYIYAVPLRFNGFDGVVFEAGMKLLTEFIYGHVPNSTMVYNSDYFFPYNAQTGRIDVTENTRTFHHFVKSWVRWAEKESLLPKVSIIIPTLSRPEGLQRCLDSIDKLLYPKQLIEVIVDHGNGTVPKKVAFCLPDATGEYIAYMADDTEFLPDSLYVAVTESMATGKGLVAFDTGVRNDEGYINEHFIIRRNLIDKIGGEIFDTDFFHIGVDDLLWKKCDKINEAMISSAKVIHHHFSRIGSGIKKDECIEKGWSREIEDRKLLQAKLLGL